MLIRDNHVYQKSLFKCDCCCLLVEPLRAAAPDKADREE
jgi:hypothetical protein